LFTNQLSRMEGKHIASYLVRAHDVSENRKIHPPALLRIMQDASLQHALKLGASVWDKQMKGHSWVLIKKEVKLYTYPSLNDKIRVETYPSHFDKYFAFRDWVVYDSGDNIIASAKSQWTVININTRKMAKLPEHLYSIALPEINLGKTNFKIVFNENPSFSKTFIVHRFDLDWNSHLNNSKLIEYMIASVPQNHFKENFTNFRIQFKSEALLGDALDIEFYPKSDVVHLRATNKRTEKIVALAELD